ncbi:MAG: phage holin family protein [Lautropia sp.]
MADLSTADEIRRGRGSQDTGLQHRSLSELLKGLADDLAMLVTQHIDLARQETFQSLQSARTGVMLLGVAAGVLFAGCLFLLLAAVLVLQRYFDDWLAALIVAGAALLLGLALVLIGRRKLSAQGLVPKRTIRTIREDSQLVRK